MEKEQPDTRKQSRSKRGSQEKAEPDTGQNGHEDAVARYEKELAGYLQERIKPGLNRGAIPLLARSIAKEIAHREHPNGVAEDSEVETEQSARPDEEPSAEADDEQSAQPDEEPSAEADDEQSAEAGDEGDAQAEDEEGAESEAPPDFEADMRDLQAELGEDWILSFSVQGEDGWLTAEKDDGSQRLEAQTAAVLSDAVALLNEGGGRSS